MLNIQRQRIQGELLYSVVRQVDRCNVLQVREGVGCQFGYLVVVQKNLNVKKKYINQTLHFYSNNRCYQSVLKILKLRRLLRSDNVLSFLG